MTSAYGILVSIGWCSATDNSPLEYLIQKSTWPVNLNGRVAEESRGVIIVD